MGQYTREKWAALKAITAAGRGVAIGYRPKPRPPLPTPRQVAWDAQQRRNSTRRGRAKRMSTEMRNGR